jgi:hypothetical protein
MITKLASVLYHNYLYVSCFHQELRALFEPFATVVEADAISGKNYGFVHIDASIGKTKLAQVVK